MNDMFKAAKVSATPAIGPEPPRRDPQTGMLSSAWQQWELAESTRAMEARRDADPVAQARRRTPDEIARIDAVEIEVKARQADLDDLVNAQLGRLPRYGAGYAVPVGIFVVTTDETTAATHRLEDAIQRRSKVRAQVDAAQTARTAAARREGNRR